MSAIPKQPQPAKKMVLFTEKTGLYPERIALSVLQGLVNRREPRLYVYHDKYENTCTGNDPWPNILTAEHGIEFEPMSDLGQVFKRFKADYQGAIEYPGGWYYDPKKWKNANILYMWCAIENLIPVSTELNKVLRIPVKHKWNLQRGYKWAYKHLWPKCSKTVLAHYHPRAYTELWDYLTANKIFTFFSTDEDRRVFDRVLDDADRNCPVLGVWGMERCGYPYGKFGGTREWDGLIHPGDDFDNERGLIRYLAEHGHYLVVAHTSPNLSVHSGFKVKLPKQKKWQRLYPEKDKVYVAWVFSEGSNIAANMYTRIRHWEKPRSIPIAWDWIPIMIDMCPSVLYHYYGVSTPNDYHVCACNGMGYTDLDAYKYQSQYLEITRQHMNKTDMKHIWIWWATDETVTRIRNSLKCNMLLETMPTFEYELATKKVNGLLTLKTMLPTPPIDVSDYQIWAKWLKNGVRNNLPAFVFVGVNGQTWSPDNVQTFMTFMPENWECVGLDTLTEFAYAPRFAYAKGGEK